MSNFLRALLGLDPEPPTVETTLDPRLVAAAALMVEAASMDGSFTDRERARIEQLLVDRFHLTPEVAAELLGEAQGHAQDSAGWHGFTTAVKDGFDHQGRIGLVEMMWEIVYADGELHDYEASLMRRITGLLYVSGGESAEARERALARLGLSPA